ncbi:MAG: HEAT repeat domain-containing protein, partial [Gammaproteobacteria bacterium]|nr:HEAT repeat domain-containing protein [Gammaproteobacteria bacterium]
LGAAAAIEPLTRALKDTSSYIRGNAAEALGRLGVAAAIEPLTRALKDTDYDVRRSTAEALGRLGAAAAIEPLTRALKDTESYVRRNAAEALGRLGAAATIKPLTRALKDTEPVYDPYTERFVSSVAVTAATALGRLGSTAGLSVLWTRLHDADAEQRQAGAYNLLRIGITGAAEDLLRLLEVPMRRTGLPAEAPANVALDPAAAWAALAQGIAGAPPALRFTALEFLKEKAEIPPPAALSAFVPLLQDRLQGVREDTLAWLMAGFPSLEKVLLVPRTGEDKLTKKETEEGASAVTIHSPPGSAGIPSAVRPEESRSQITQTREKEKFAAALLHIALNPDEYFGLRNNAVNALGKLRHAESLTALVKNNALESGLRLRAAHLLGPTGPDAVEILLPLVKERAKSFEKNSLEIFLKIPYNAVLGVREDKLSQGKAEIFLPDLYRALAKTDSEDPRVPELLAEHLKKLTEDKETWREQRDTEEEKEAKGARKNPGGCERVISDYEDKQYWHYKAHEFQLGYALARLAPKSYALELLDHPLRRVRRGAIQAVAESFDAVLLQSLDIERAQSPDPIFRHAAYRAIDTGLLYLETSDRPEVLRTLQAWHAETRDYAIKDRLEWTLGWVEYRVKKANNEK